MLWLMLMVLVIMLKFGNAVIEIPALRPGSYNADVTYAGDENYKNATASVSITVPDEPVVEPKDPNLKASVENTTVSVTVDKDATGYVVVDVDGTSYYAEIENGKAVISIPALRPGSYSADVTYAVKVTMHQLKTVKQSLMSLVWMKVNIMLLYLTLVTTHLKLLTLL